MTQLLWYLRRQGAVSGPFPVGQLREQVRAGELSATDEASLDGMSWTPLGQCEPFRDWLTQLPDRLETRGESETAVREHEITRQMVLEQSRRRPSLWIAGIAALAILMLAGVIWLAQPSDTLQPGLAKTGDCSHAAAPRVSWRGCEHAGADLAGASLRGADLVQANLEGADLSAADLAHANLGLARLRGARLRRANLTGAALNGAILVEADLSGADLRYTSLRGARLEAARLDGVLLGNATWIDGRICAEGSIGLCR